MPVALSNRLPASSNDTAPIDTKLKLDQVLGVWHRAWQGRDIETYRGMRTIRVKSYQIALMSLVCITNVRLSNTRHIWS